MQAPPINYYQLLFSLFAKVAEEINPPPGFDTVLAVFERGTQLQNQVRSSCRSAFIAAKDSQETAAEIATELHTRYRKQPHILAGALLCLLQLSAEGHTIPKQLNDLLESIAAEFGFSADTFYKLRSDFVRGEVSTERVATKSADKKFCEATMLSRLGCAKTASNAEIRGAYRRLALIYHPDAYASLPLAESVVKAITARFYLLQEAYEMLKKHRGIR